MSKWTRFMDMHSGGGLKEKWQYIYIEADAATAKTVFYNRFKHNPERVTCTCCGEDYSIEESESFEQASGFERGCEWVDGHYEERPNKSERGLRKYLSVEAYLKRPDVHVIYARDITPEERILPSGGIPVQGYVWA